MKIILSTSLLVLFSVMFVIAQETPKPPQDFSVDGNIQKIVIITDKCEKVFEGKDAEELGRILTAPRHKMMWIDKNDGRVPMHPKMNKFIFKEDATEGIEKNINVEIKDGKKVVTITTSKDGEEKVEVLTDEDAENWIKDYEGKSEVDMNWVVKDSSDSFVFIAENGDRMKMRRHHHVMWEEMPCGGPIELQVEKLEGDLHRIKMELGLMDAGITQKVIIKEKNKDGKFETKVLVGEEAEKYINENDEITDENGKVIIIKKVAEPMIIKEKRIEKIETDTKKDCK